MPEQIKVLSSRRAYEFGADNLRLTILSAQQVQQQLLHTFRFQAAQTGTPPETFGTVPQTAPPGLVFALGEWTAHEGEVLPIRVLAFEPRRIVVDVAGPSSSMDTFYEALVHVLNSVPTPDGSLVVGTPNAILDYSEITAHLSFAPDAGLVPGLNALMAKALGADASAVSIPIYTAQLHTGDEEFPGAKNLSKGFLQFTLRAGTKVEDNIYFSGAPLSSGAHIAYLGELEALLSKKRANR